MPEARCYCSFAAGRPAVLAALLDSLMCMVETYVVDIFAVVAWQLSVWVGNVTAFTGSKHLTLKQFGFLCVMARTVVVEGQFEPLVSWRLPKMSSPLVVLLLMLLTECATCGRCSPGIGAQAWAFCLAVQDIFEVC